MLNLKFLTNRWVWLLATAAILVVTPPPEALCLVAAPSVSVGEDCLLEANPGLGTALGNQVQIEAGFCLK